MGGTGLIGSQVVRILNASGHVAGPHSPRPSGATSWARSDSPPTVTIAPSSPTTAPAFRGVSGDVLVAKDGAVIAKTAHRDWLGR